ncbi:MAG: hypothetical protein ABIR91_00880 [Candidatus Saccharimonadales bacterium]
MTERIQSCTETIHSDDVAIEITLFPPEVLLMFRQLGDVGLQQAAAYLALQSPVN